MPDPSELPEKRCRVAQCGGRGLGRRSGSGVRSAAATFTGSTLAAVMSATVRLAALPFAAVAFTAVAFTAVACTTGAQRVRINPHLDGPERWHITCKEEFLACEREAKKICEDFLEISRDATGKEPKRVRDSEMSSTAPEHGVPHWEGHLIIQCGEELPPLRLVRPPAEQQPGIASGSGGMAGSSPTTGSSSTIGPSGSPRAGQGGGNLGAAGGAPGSGVCVPGETQACLGPGACQGAQFCLRDATGYSPCDCGATGAPAPATPPVPAAP